MEKSNTDSLTPQERRRYSRQILLRGVGAQGQLKLKHARVLLVGMGGLGCPAGLYLAAAGVGTLGLVDFDKVDESNLQRQILYTTKDVGNSKLETAKQRLTALNVGISIELFEERLTAQNAPRLFERFDLILDGTDNFETRYIVNDACLRAGKPNVFGSVFRFEGRVSVFSTKDGPCYRCLHPQPPSGEGLSCAEAGVLGVLPGIVGTLQALEAVKLIVGVGQPLIGRLMLFDGLAMEWRTLTLKKNPSCPACPSFPK